MNKKVAFIITAVCGSVAWAIVSLALLGANPWTEVQAFEVRCSTSATAIRQAARHTGFDFVKCQNISSTPVFFGGSSLDTRGAFPVCNDSSACASPMFEIDAGMSLYCKVNLGQVSVKCITGR